MRTDKRTRIEADVSPEAKKKVEHYVKKNRYNKMTMSWLINQLILGTDLEKFF